MTSESLAKAMAEIRDLKKKLERSQKDIQVSERWLSCILQREKSEFYSQDMTDRIVGLSIAPSEATVDEDRMRDTFTK